MDSTSVTTSYPVNQMDIEAGIDAPSNNHSNIISRCITRISCPSLCNPNSEVSSKIKAVMIASLLLIIGVAGVAIVAHYDTGLILQEKKINVMSAILVSASSTMIVIGLIGMLVGGMCGLRRCLSLGHATLCCNGSLIVE